MRADREEVDVLRAAGRLAGERETLLVRDRVDRGRLAGIGAAGEREFRQPEQRQLMQPIDRREKRACWRRT